MQPVLSWIEKHYERSTCLSVAVQTHRSCGSWVHWRLSSIFCGRTIAGSSLSSSSLPSLLSSSLSSSTVCRATPSRRCLMHNIVRFFMSSWMDRLETPLSGDETRDAPETERWHWIVHPLIACLFRKCSIQDIIHWSWQCPTNHVFLHVWILKWFQYPWLEGDNEFLTWSHYTIVSPNCQFPSCYIL